MGIKAIFAIVLVAFCAAAVQAAPEVLWKQDFGSSTTGSTIGGGEIVEDAAAPGGKALRLTFTKEGKLPAVASAKGLPLAGRGTLRLMVRGAGLNDIANGLRFTVVLNPEAGGAASIGDAVVYGIRSSGETYRVLPISFNVADAPGKYTMVISPNWLKQTSDRKPTVWLGGMELLANGTKAPYISGVFREGFDYAPGMNVKVSAAVLNPTDQAFRGRLALKERFGLDGCTDAAGADVTLAAGEVRKFDLAWTASQPEAGCSLVFSLLDKDGQEMDRDQLPMGIVKDSRELSFPSIDFSQSRMYPTGGASYYVGTTSYALMKREVGVALRDRNNLGGRSELFSWSWCDLAGFIAPEDPYIGNEGQYWLSLKNRKEQIALGKSIGCHMDSYINGCLWNAPAMELYHRHPDWFMYDSNGELTGMYDMEVYSDYSRRHEFNYMIKHSLFFEVNLDPTRDDTREFIARQIISLGKVMGFQGARWDVWNMNVEPGMRRLDGTEIVRNWEEADRLSAESLKAVKDMVAKELPDFTWGYNYAAPEENKNTPLLFAEKCKGHGWLLDECEIGYGEKTSPYHYWNAYDKRMVEWGDHVRQLCGIYDPWTFARGDLNCGCSEADWLYSTIFRLVAGGRAWNSLYKNDSALVGDLPLMAFRFSDTFNGWNLRLQPETQTQISVEAPASLWWKGHVFSNKTFEKKDQFIVHLVNAPAADEVRENPESKARPPILNVKVRCNALKGRLPQKAWLVMAEPVTPDQEPQVQAVPLVLEKQGSSAVSVTVPAVLFLKTVVFEY